MSHAISQHRFVVAPLLDLGPDLRARLPALQAESRPPPLLTRF